jgi:hypothetical protein
VSSYESTTDDLHGHGTHVAGIVASQDSTYKGVAPGVYLLNEKVAYLNALGGATSPFSAAIAALEHSYDYWSEIVQYSYGWYPPDDGYDYDAWTQGNTEISKTFDAYVEAGLTCTISAGNDGSSYDTISVPGDAFNVITVGNFDDKNTVSRSDDDVHWSSSRGYTGDGRTKPDVAAPGTYIRSTNAFWETQPDFISFTGTSMAAPHVAGIAALEIDEWARLYSERLSGRNFVYGGPLAIRAMIYNSADESTGESSGAMNDRISGTGYVDAYEAWGQAWKPTVKIISLTDTNDAYYTIDVNPGATIKATIAWNRHVDLDTIEAVPQLFLTPKNSLLFGFRAMPSFLFYPFLNCWTASITPKTLSDIDLKLRDLSGTVLASSSDAQTNWEKVAYTYTGASPTTLRIHVHPWSSVPSEVGTETIALASTHTILQDDTIGVYRNGQWILRNSNSAGGANYRFNFGNPTDKPVTGDWNGDGVDTIGVYRNGQWILRNSNSAGGANYRFNFGNPTDKPVTGDWNGDGVDTIGVYRNGQWILRDSNSAGSASYRFNYGNPTDVPVTGDWDGA